MSLAAPIEYTDAAQMLRDYAERRKRMFARVPKIIAAPPRPPKPAVIEAAREEQGPPKPTARHILAMACRRHGLKISAVVGDRRHKPLVECRQEAAWLIAKYTDLSYPRIGALLGKDHTTILYAVRRHNDRKGENVRGAGGVPDVARERNRKAAAKYKRRSVQQKLRVAELLSNREDFRL